MTGDCLGFIILEAGFIIYLYVQRKRFLHLLAYVTLHILSFLLFVILDFLIDLFLILLSCHYNAISLLYLISISTNMMIDILNMDIKWTVHII